MAAKQANQKGVFPRWLARRRKEQGHTTESLAAACDFETLMGVRDGAGWLRQVESGKSAGPNRAACGAMEAALGLQRDELWTLLLMDDRKVDPEVRAYYESRLRDAEAIQGDLTEDERALIVELRRHTSFQEANAWRKLRDEGGGFLATYSPATRDYLHLLRACREAPRVPDPVPFAVALERPREVRDGREPPPEQRDGEVILARFLIELAKLPPTAAVSMLGNFTAALETMTSVVQWARDAVPTWMRDDASAEKP